jgi:hypothetical protein
MVWGLPLQPQQSKSRDIARAEFERRQRRQPQTRPVFSTRLTGTARTVGALAQLFFRAQILNILLQVGNLLRVSFFF